MPKQKLFVGNTRKKTIREIYEEYISSQSAKGISDITLRNYR